MRILIVGLKAPIGGIERIVTDYVSRFPKEGNRYDFALFSTDENLELLIKKAGGSSLVVPSRKQNYRAYKHFVNELLKNGNYDAVWCHYSGLTNIDFLVYGKKYNVPVRIAHSHVSALSWTGKLMQYLVPIMHNKNKKRLHRYATHFWACSKAAGEFMFPERVLPQLEIKHNAISPSVFSADETTRKQAKEDLNLQSVPVIGHVARFCKEKNQFFLLDVFAKLLQSVPQAKLLMVGTGELFDEVKAYAEKLNICKSVIFAGFQTNVTHYLNASDVFFLPSYTEGLVVAAIEAQACGLPCVVSEGVTQEVDISGNVRFLSFDAPLDEWANALKEALNSGIMPNPEKNIQEAGYDIDKEAATVYGEIKACLS